MKKKPEELIFDTKVDPITNDVKIEFSGFRNHGEAENFADWLHKALEEWFNDMNKDTLQRKIKKDEPTRH